MSPCSPAMASSASEPGRESATLPRLPDWVVWFQTGLTVLLAVLFVVVLAKAREQTSRVQELQERVQGLENSRALERTTGLEQQLRATVERLQALERGSARIDVLSAENDALRGEVRQLRRSAATPRPSSETQLESGAGNGPPLSPPLGLPSPPPPLVSP